MKAYLVIDMPTACCDCRFCDADVCFAIKPYKELTNTLSKPDWCPLKPLPQRKGYTEPKELEDYKVSQMLVMANADGWNACLDEITGKENG